jgi:hypothetical protein
MDFPRFNLEQRLVMELCGRIDPDDIYQYVAEGGYEGLVKALGSDPEEVITEIETSGPAASGDWQEVVVRMQKSSSATQTKGTPAPIWIAPFLKVTLTSCWKAWRSVLTP